MRAKSVLMLFFITFTFLANAQFKHISNPYIKNYTTKDYNGQPDNFAAIEDNRGFLFFGNLWGILEFDGINWRNIYFPNGSSGVSFAKDNKGVIYCGGRGEFGYLAPDSNGFLQYFSLVHLLPEKIDFSEVWATVYVDSSIVFCSFEALFVFKNNTIRVIAPKLTFGRAFLAHGKLYVANYGHGLCRLNKHNLELVKGGEFFAYTQASVILPYNDEQLIIANDINFYLYNGRAVKPWNNDVPRFLNGSKLFTGLLLNDSSYILATNTKGIIMMDNQGKIEQVYNKTLGLVSNDVLNLYNDSNGNIWLLTRGGISKIEFNGCFSYVNEFCGIAGLNYASCVYNNRLYLGTSDGLYVKELNHSKEKTLSRNFTMISSFEGNVWALQQIGEELFCGHNDGVYIINKDKLYHVAGTKGVWCFLQPKGFKNIVLAGTYVGIVVLEKKGEWWQTRNYVKGFNESSRFFMQDEMEEFWISHGNKGLFKLTLSHTLDSVLKIKSFGLAEGVYSEFNNTVYGFNKQVVITNNRGFFKYNYQKEYFEPWNEINTTLGKFTAIQRFVPESDNSFWVIINDERVLHISKNRDNEYSADITIRKFNKRLAGSFEHILPLNNNVTLIATLEGFAFFDREKYNQNIVQSKKYFKSYIRSIELTRDSITTINAGERSDVSENNAFVPEIKYKQNSLRFSFSSNCFEDIELTQYQFFLAGFDHTWSPWSATSQKEYTNLPAGRYKFMVRAINSYNVISKEDAFEFVILPPWYKSMYAYAFYFLLLFLVLWGGYRYILFRFTLQKRRLELKKQRELQYLSRKHLEEQIKNENEILKLTNEKLSADIANLEQKELLRLKEQQLKEELDRARQEQLQHEQEKHILEITHKNKELSILAMQIAHKSESIAKIREYLVNFTEKNNSPDFKTMAAHLFEYIDKDIELDKEWKEFQEHFEMVHSSFLNKLKATYPSISPTLLKLSAYLRVKMSNKQIARLMNTTVESVLKSRYRLREKLQLGSDESLDDFIEKF